MSNEELVMKIQGGAVELKGELWEQIKRLVYKLCSRYVTFAYKHCRLDKDDIINTAWFGVERAIVDYTAEKGLKFTSYLNYHIHNTLMELLDLRGRKDPLNDCSSLYDTIPGDMAENLTVLDTIEDETAPAAFDDINDRLTNEWIWEEVSRIDKRCSIAITEHYKHGKSLSEIGATNNVSAEAVRQWERNGLRQLRKNNALRDYWADVYGYRHIGVNTFNNTWTSSTEFAALKMLEEAIKGRQLIYTHEHTSVQKKTVENKI